MEIGRVSLWLVAFAAAVPQSGAVAADATGVDDLRPLPVPEWVQKCLVSSFTPPTTEEGWRVAVDAGLQAVHNIPGMFDGGLFPWYDGEKLYVLQPGKPFSEAVPLDTARHRAEVEKVQKRGIRAIGVMMRTWEVKVLADHPDWQWLPAPDARPADPFSVFPPPDGCWISPFGDWYIRKNEAMLNAFGWDGQSIDGFGNNAFALCYCPHCKDKFRQATGGEVPLAIEPADPNYRRYVTWRMREWGKFAQRWERALKKINPEFAFIPWSTGPGRWWHWLYLPQGEGSELGNLMIDAPMVELFWDFPPDQGSNLLPSFTVRFHRGFCSERPVWMLPYFRSQGQAIAVTPRVESEFRLFTVLANGAAPGFADFLTSKDVPITHFYDLTTKRAPWIVGATSVKWAAMVVSERTRLFYGIQGTRGEFGGPNIGSGVDTKDLTKLPPGERRMPAHMEAAIGMFRACQEAHLPLDIVSDLDIEQATRLSDYRVLILPDAACLSELAMANIRRFVANGGGLIASQCTSLYDENGSRRQDFGLADLFGAAFVSAEDHTARWPNFPSTAHITLRDHEISTDPAISGARQAGREDIEYIGWTARVRPQAAANVVAEWIPVKEYVPQIDDRNPFIITSERGKGRVVYFASALDQAYFISPFQYQRPLMVNAIRWAAGAAVPPIEVSAPMCVQATFYQQNEGRRTIVHLLNELNTTADRALPEMNPPMREEVIPLAGIKVFFRDGSIKSAMLQPEGTRLDLKRVDDGVEVTVPKLELHSMVVAER